jgi:iron complex transport system ATP-binding protein
MISLEQVKKSYTDDVRLGPIDLTIPKGGLTALIGPNGAGKSTTLMMIGRLLDLDAGQIEVAGMDLTSSKSKDLAKINTILRVIPSPFVIE